MLHRLVLRHDDDRGPRPQPMVNVLAIRVPKVVASAVPGEVLPRARVAGREGDLACTHESCRGSAPHVARCVTAARHGYEQPRRRCCLLPAHIVR
jgi:hypothetical protein